MKRILVFGTFDKLHPGHLFFLHAAEARGELWVAIAHDKTVERIKGVAPTQTQEERQRAVREAFPSAHVIPGDEEDYLVPLHTVQPDILLLGYDQKFPPGISPTDIPCTIERLPAYKPEKYKSSILREAGAS